MMRVCADYIYDNCIRNTKQGENCNWKKVVINLCVVFVMLITIFSVVIDDSITVNAAEGDGEIVVYTVLTRSNLREAPSGSGNWLATVPGGALVIPVCEQVDGYVLIVYGEYKGYIYGGCITEAIGKSYEDYCKQFPEIDVEAVNKKFGVGQRTVPDKKYMPTEAQKYQDNKEKIAENNIDNKTEDNVKENNADNTKDNNADNTKDNKVLSVTESTDNNIDNKSQQKIDKQVESNVTDLTAELSKDENAIAPIEDKHKTEYVDFVSRDTKEITGPDVKIYNEEINPLDVGGNFTTKDVVIVAGTNSDNGGVSKGKTVNSSVLVTTHMRQLPTSESQKLLTITAGTTVTVLDDGENGFIHIRYDGQEGYAFARCFDYKMGAAYVGSTIETKTETSVESASGEIALSSRKYLSKTAVASLVEDGDVVQEIADVEEEKKVVKVSASKSSEKVKENVSKEISARVNMRALPTSDSAKIMSLPIGADIKILGQSTGGYTLVQYNGVAGYVLEDWIVDSVAVTNKMGQLGADAIIFDCTAYCACAKCCGSYSPEVTGREAHTATGTIPTEGRTIAVDPTVIPYGTSVYIEGMGTYIAEDCGGGVKGNHIDIYFATHEAAVQFGRRRLNVSIQR